MTERIYFGSLKRIQASELYSNKSFLGYSVSVLLVLFVVSLIAMQTGTVSAQVVNYNCPTQLITYTVPGANGLPLQITTSVPAGSVLPWSTPPAYAMVTVPGVGSVPVTSPPGTPGGLPIAYVPGQGYVVVGGTLTRLGQQYLAELTQPAYTIVHSPPTYGTVTIPGVGTVPILNSPGPVTTPWASSPSTYGTAQTNSGVGCGNG